MFLNHRDVDFAFGIDTEEGHRLFTVVSSWTEDLILIDGPHIAVACDLQSIPLVPGNYLVSASIVFRGDTLDAIQHCASFEILPSPDGVYSQRLGHGPA